MRFQQAGCAKSPLVRLGLVNRKGTRCAFVFSKRSRPAAISLESHYADMNRGFHPIIACGLHGNSAVLIGRLATIEFRLIGASHGRGLSRKTKASVDRILQNAHAIRRSHQLD